MSAFISDSKRSSNPVGVNLTEAGPKYIDQLAKRFNSEGCRLSFQGVTGQFYEFFATASTKNKHKGTIYRIIVGRDNPKEPVTGVCGCIHSGLCKHLSAAYLEAKDLNVSHRIKFCECGKEFLVARNDDSDFCFFCLTEATEPARQEPTGQPIKRGAGQDNTCAWCHKFGERESLCLWGVEGARYYAHSSCEVRNRVKHA